MAITLDGTTGITTPDLTSVDDITANSATVLTTAGVPASAMPAGSVLQVVEVSTTASFNTTSASDVATGLIATITPISATSKILVMLSGGAADYGPAATNASVTLYRDINSGGYSSLALLERLAIGAPTWSLPHSANYLDSPSTTSTVSYQPYIKTNNTYLFSFNNGYGVRVSLILMEIAA